MFLSPKIHASRLFLMDGLHVIRHAGFGRQLVYLGGTILYERLYQVVTSEHSGEPQQPTHEQRERYADQQYRDGNAQDEGGCTEGVGDAGGERHGVPAGRPARS